MKTPKLLTGMYEILSVSVSSHEHHAHNNDKKRANCARSNIATLLSQRNHQCRRGARWGKQSKHSTTLPANHLAPLTLHKRHSDNESGRRVGDITGVTRGHQYVVYVMSLTHNVTLRLMCNVRLPWRPAIHVTAFKYLVITSQLTVYERIHAL